MSDEVTCELGKVALLNCSSAKNLGKKIKVVNHESIFRQQSIGANRVLFGFFEFIVKTEKDDSCSCTLKNVSKSNILEYLRYSGFRRIYLNDGMDYMFIKVENNVIHEIPLAQIRSQCYDEFNQRGSIKIEMQNVDQFDFSWKLLDTVYLQFQDQIFNKNFLELLDEFNTPQLKDTRTETFFLFQNTIVKVTSEEVVLLPYKHLELINKCIWKNHILPREYYDNGNLPISEYKKFIENVANHEEKRILAFNSATGYLLNKYNGSHMGQSVICYDEQPTDVKNPQGGTGKGLFATGISHMKETVSIDGKAIKVDSSFNFSAVNRTTQVIVINDLKKEVPWDMFFSMQTDGFTIEKKHQNSIKLSPEDSPKMLYSMNAVILNQGTSYTRRMFIIEFNNYYSRKIVNGTEKPIEDEHGVLFDRISWNENEWNSFSKYMISCSQLYLKKGLISYDLINVGKNSLIQQTSEEFCEWMNLKNFQAEVIYKTKDLFHEYRDTYFGENAEFNQRSFTNMLKKYATTMHLEMKIQTNTTSKVSEFVFHSKVNSL